MSTNNTDHVMFHIGTAIMVINIILCIIFAVITKSANDQHQQRLSTRTNTRNTLSSSKSSHGSSVMNKNNGQYISYFVYSFAVLCTIQCFLCHYSMIWYFGGSTFCRWAAPICLVIFFSAKAFLYGFFLERAKLSQGLLNIFPFYLFKYLLPIYIFLYWVIWSICIMIFFEGIPSDSVTSCITTTNLPWILKTGAIIDIFNTMFFLFLFIYPLYKTYMMNKAAFDNNSSKKKNFITMMWYNMILSTICTVSSFIFLFIFPDIYGYVRFGEQVDMMINSICVFFMLASNRKYCYSLCSDCCAHPDKHQQNKEYETVDTRTNIEIGDIEQDRTNTESENNYQ